MNALAAWSGRLAIVLLVLLAGVLTLRRLHDYDVFWHVATGEWILSEGRVPRADPFGAMTRGRPWLDVAWAAQVMMALAVRRVGLAGLQLGAVAVVMLSVALLLRRAPLTACVLSAGAVFVLTGWSRFLVRPDLLTLPATALLLIMIERLPRSPLRVTALLFGLTAAWANLHGSFVLVPLALASAALAALVVPSARAGLRAYGGALLVSVLAASFNPYGLRIYEVLLPYVRTSLSALGLLAPAERLYILEWMPIWELLAQGAAAPRIALPCLAAILVLTFALVGQRSVPAVRLAVVAALAVLAVMAARHLLPFASATLCAIVLNERDRQRLRPPEPRSRAERVLDGAPVRAAVAIGVCLFVAFQGVAAVTNRFYVRRDLAPRAGLGVDLALVSEGAALWLGAYEPPGTIFNNFDSGAYLLHRLYPRFAPYTDARVADARWFSEVQSAVRDVAGFDALVLRDGIGTVVLVHPSPESVLLLPRLARDPRWRLAFRDHNSTIHVRADLDAPVARAEPWPLVPVEERLAIMVNSKLERLACDVLPAADLTDAYISGLMGDRPRQLTAYRRALTLAPHNPRARAAIAALEGRGTR